MQKQPVFWHISGNVRRISMFIENQYVTFYVLPFCISVPNFMEKFKVQLKKFKKYRFSSENGLFPGILRKFRLQKSISLTIEPCLMMGIVINNVFERTDNEM